MRDAFRAFSLVLAAGGVALLALVWLEVRHSRADLRNLEPRLSMPAEKMTTTTTDSNGREVEVETVRSISETKADWIARHRQSLRLAEEE